MCYVRMCVCVCTCICVYSQEIDEYIEDFDNDDEASPEKKKTEEAIHNNEQVDKTAAAADEDGDGAPLPPAVAPLLSPLCRSAASATEVARALLQRLRAVHEISTTDGDADNAGATEQGRAVLALMGAVLDAATTSKVRTAIALELQVGLKTVAQQLEAGAGAGAGAERCSSPLVPCITGLGALNTRVAGLTISTQ